MARKPRINNAASPAVAGPTVASLQRESFHIHEDGTAGREHLSVSWYEDDLFRIQLPSYISTALKLDPFVEADTPAGAIEAYEAACEHYSALKLADLGAPKLMIRLAWTTRPEELAAVGMSARTGVEYTSKDGELKFMEKNEDGSFNQALSLVDGCIVLPATPDLIAKTEELKASIRRADEILAGLKTAADPAAYLLAIQFESKPKQVTLMGLDTESLKSFNDAMTKAAGALADIPDQINGTLNESEPNDPFPQSPVDDESSNDVSSNLVPDEAPVPGVSKYDLDDI